MGAYVSIPDCKSHYNVTLDCSYNLSTAVIGGLTKGEFGSDSDIAGIGVLGAFFGVTAFALFMSIFDVVWQLAKAVKWKYRLTEEERVKSRKKWSATDIMEALIQACSDQQIFTGAAYAITLRYSQGCSISAYHYNIVSNIVLLTCATHLMSVTVIRDFWRYPWLSVLRGICVTGVFILAGVLMANQNATDTPESFPTGVPAADTTDSLMFLPAACFQDNSTGILGAFKDSTSSANQFGVATLQESKPRNRIQGWNLYIVMLMFYLAAGVVEFIRWVRRSSKRVGRRRTKAFVAWVGRGFPRDKVYGRFFRKLVEGFFLLYLLGGIAISCAIVVIQGKYVFALRRWVNNSGWMELEDGQNPENDATSFGQLVPICLTALTLFAFLGIISEKTTEHRNVKYQDEVPPSNVGNIHFLDPSQYDFGNMKTSQNGHEIQVAASPGGDPLASPTSQSLLMTPSSEVKPACYTDIENLAASNPVANSPVPPTSNSVANSPTSPATNAHSH